MHKMEIDFARVSIKICGRSVQLLTLVEIMRNPPSFLRESLEKVDKRKSIATRVRRLSFGFVAYGNISSPCSKLQLVYFTCFRNSLNPR